MDYPSLEASRALAEVWPSGGEQFWYWAAGNYSIRDDPGPQPCVPIPARTFSEMENAITARGWCYGLRVSPNESEAQIFDEHGEPVATYPSYDKPMAGVEVLALALAAALEEKGDA